MVATIAWLSESLVLLTEHCAEPAVPVSFFLHCSFAKSRRQVPPVQYTVVRQQADCSLRAVTCTGSACVLTAHCKVVKPRILRSKLVGSMKRRKQGLLTAYAHMGNTEH